RRAWIFFGVVAAASVAGLAWMLDRWRAGSPLKGTYDGSIVHFCRMAFYNLGPATTALAPDRSSLVFDFAAVGLLVLASYGCVHLWKRLGKKLGALVPGLVVLSLVIL